jgi:hypothetical protein
MENKHTQQVDFSNPNADKITTGTTNKPMDDSISEEKMNKDTLYSEIELLIIRWNIDGTKTAGSLTRDIIELIKKQDERNT